MADGNRKYQVVESNNIMLGQIGFDLINDTSLHTGRFVALKAINADVILTSATTALGDDLAGETIIIGDVIFGNFDTVTRASGGKIVAYRG